MALGRQAGAGITTANNNIVIGHGTGVHSRFGQEDNVCYIENIYGANVNNMGGIARVRVGRSRWEVGHGGSRCRSIFSPTRPAPSGSQPDGQTMLNRKVEALQATAEQQQKRIEILTAQLKEQAAQIQKVSAQLEASKPAPKIVANK